MPSPFPGMDPYLEAPALWPDVHQRLITYIADALQPQVRPHYHTRIGERLYVADTFRVIYSDVTIVGRPIRETPQVAVAERVERKAVIPGLDAPLRIIVESAEIREPFVEIVHTAGGEVVTVIEVLSPTNKASGRSHELYLRKQYEVLDSAAHLVEIDLLSQGAPTVAFPAMMRAALEAHRYLVCVLRKSEPAWFELYPVPLPQRLPCIGVPLREPDPDVALDLQAAFALCYDNGGYADFVDYGQPPPVPLSDDELAWVENLLKDELRYDMVVFDVGGTLLGFHEHEPFQEFLAAAGLPAADEDARQLQRRLISIITADREGAQGLGADEAELWNWWRGIFAKTWSDRPDPSGSSPSVRSLADEMLRWLFAGRFDRLFADVRPALEELQRLGLPMAVLSNFGTHLHDVLKRFDLLRFFEFVVVSAAVELAKPDPRIFDLTVSKANKARNRLLYVGDHVGDDIEGARGAGVDAVLIDRGDRHPEARCPRIGSLLDLAHYVRPPKRPAIIFDMDGVVLDSMPTHLLTWQQTLAPLGIEMTADDLYPLEGLPTEPTAQRLTEKLLGQACSDEKAQRLANTKRAIFGEIFEPTLVPGIAPLLYDLRGRGYRLGLVTGSARSVVDESLAPTGVAELFDAIVTGDQVSRGKPAPEPYRTAAARMDVSPAECLVVENAPLGIQSAQAAGMECVALETTLPAGWLPPVDRVFPDAVSLRGWLLTR